MPKTDDQLRRFVMIDPSDRKWLKIGPINVYVRCGPRVQRVWVSQMVHTLEIASVQVQESRRHRGIFTRWLTTKVEPLADARRLYVYAENILSPEFRAFFTRRGYLPAGEMCMIRAPAGPPETLARDLH